MKYILIALALIALANIAGSFMFTICKMSEIDKSKKGVCTALYFAFTILGIYAAGYLLF